ncbi:MAG: hypothetical protein ACRD2N_25620 [Vicinamibacterales bacterium]
MKTVIGAIAGALAVSGMLFAFDLGGRRAIERATMMPTTQMMIGPDGVARPYLVSQPSYGQLPYATSPGWSPYGVAPATVVPYGAVPARVQYANEQIVTERPVVRRVSTQRPVYSEPVVRRTWQKSALLIGGSAGAGAGLGALIGGKKGALAGAAIGGGAAAIYDQTKRR